MSLQVGVCLQIVLCPLHNFVSYRLELQEYFFPEQMVNRYLICLYVQLMILMSVKLTEITAHSMPPALTKMDRLNANVMMVTMVMVLPVKVTYAHSCSVLLSLERNIRQVAGQ